ncbi:MAG TPA: hypothetical protein VHN37_04515, partial [Actinomycetota bacterium]|nr:hypothetical protein [Actinomycetota bacterium]
PDVSISGAGRVTGIALVEVGVRPWDGRAALLAVNLDFCGEPGCRSEEGPYLKTSGFLPAENERYPIPAGDYLLYTITDGAPVTVELTLDGLRGRTRIRPGRPAPEVSVGAPPETLWDSSAGAGAAYGETYADAGDEAIMLTAFRVRSDVSATSRYGVCLYEGEPATPAPVAYAYPCAGGFGVYVGGPASVGPYQVLFHQAVHTIADGGATWSFGGGYVSPPPPTEFEHVQLHLPLPPGVVETSGVPARGSCGAAGRHFAAGVCVRLPHATGTVSTR